MVRGLVTHSLGAAPAARRATGSQPSRPRLVQLDRDHTAAQTRRHGRTSMPATSAKTSVPPRNRPRPRRAMACLSIPRRSVRFGVESVEPAFDVSGVADGDRRRSRRRRLRSWSYGGVGLRAGDRWLRRLWLGGRSVVGAARAVIAAARLWWRLRGAGPAGGAAGRPALPGR